MGQGATAHPGRGTRGGVGGGGPGAGGSRPRRGPRPTYVGRVPPRAEASRRRTRQVSRQVRDAIGDGGGGAVLSNPALRAPVPPSPCPNNLPPPRRPPSAR